MVSPFSSALARVAQLHASLAAFSLHRAQIERAFDDSLEPLREDNAKRNGSSLRGEAQTPPFFFKSQSAALPLAPANPAFNAKHPRARGGKFAAKAQARPANLAGLVLPKSRGRWIGERGQGVWLPRSLKARAIAPNGVEYRNGFPDFSPHLHHIEEEDATGRVVEVTGEVEMPSGFVGERAKDFALADRLIAQRMGWTKRDGTPNSAKAERYRVDKRLVWHHHEDCDRPRMLLIPAIVHQRAPHSGGHSLCAPKMA